MVSSVDDCHLKGGLFLRVGGLHCHTGPHREELVLVRREEGPRKEPSSVGHLLVFNPTLMISDTF